MNKISALILSSLAAFLIMIILVFYQNSFPSHGNDLFFPLCGARAIYHGVDPYGGACKIIFMDREYPTNPMTTIVSALPFAWMGIDLGAITMWSLMNGILFYGIFRSGRMYLLWMFLSPTYLLDFNHLQWAPLMAGIVLLPDLLPLSIVKPQTALPVILTNLTRRRVIGMAVFGLATLVLDPNWPLHWLRQTTTYDGFIPLLILPLGPLLLLALLRWREKGSLFVLLMALSPQRGFYDQLPLWTVTKNRWQAVALSILSWVGYLLWLTHVGSIRYEYFVIAFMYLPALAFNWISSLDKLQVNRVRLS